MGQGNGSGKAKTEREESNANWGRGGFSKPAGEMFLPDLLRCRRRDRTCWEVVKHPCNGENTGILEEPEGESGNTWELQLYSWESGLVPCCEMSPGCKVKIYLWAFVKVLGLRRKPRGHEGRRTGRPAWEDWQKVCCQFGDTKLDRF